MYMQWQSIITVGQDWCVSYIVFYIISHVICKQNCVFNNGIKFLLGQAIELS